MNKDDKINVFDFLLLKRELFNKIYS
ncbi:MAG: hypothetical protein LBM93_04795 [Oscillospiraceae bacterium]|nr:hypothetical protein [Oscillospiraceae bacterium]